MTAPRRASEAELHALVDGELTGEERAEVEALLAAAPADQALAREFSLLNEAMQSQYAGRLTEAVPPAMLRLLEQMPRRAPASAGRTWSIAAAILIALTAGLAGYLVRSLMPGAPRAEPRLVQSIPKAKKKGETLVRARARNEGLALTCGVLLEDPTHPDRTVRVYAARGRPAVLTIRSPNRVRWATPLLSREWRGQRGSVKGRDGSGAGDPAAGRLPCRVGCPPCRRGARQPGSSTSPVCAAAPRGCSEPQGATRGSRITAGIPTAIVSRKNVGQPVISATRPAGATIRSRAKAIKLVSRAYCVAENRRLHRLIMNATNTAVTSPPLTFSITMAVTSRPRLGPVTAIQ